MSAGEEAGDPISAHVWRISAVVIVGSIMSILDTTIVNVALATLSHELHSTIDQIQWVVTGYLLALAAVIPVTGWAARRFGAKQVYLVSLVLFTTGSALCGLATSTTELIVFRVLQGVGGGMILPIGQLMMAEAAGPKRMGRVMSVVAVPAMLAPILGPTIGGLIIQNASWRWIFYVNVPIGAIAVFAALRYLPWIKPDQVEKLDTRGLLLMATGLTLLTYGLAEIGATGGFTSLKVIIPCIVGPVLVAAFVLHALRVPKPLLDMRLYRKATFSSASFAMFCLGAALFGGMILLPLYWQDVRLESVVDTGLLTAPQGLGAALAMPIAGKLTDRWGGGGPRAVRRDPLHGRDDSIRPDLRPLVDPRVVRGDVRARDRDRLWLPARDGGGIRGARTVRALKCDPAAERDPARGRLDRHGHPRGRAPARPRRRPRPQRSRRRLRHGVLGGGRADGGSDHSVHHPDARRARRAASQGSDCGAIGRDDGGGDRGVTAAAREALSALGDVVGEREHGDATEEVARSFKRALAALRRMRGRETHCPGELTDAQYSLLFCLRDQSQLSVRDLAEAADLSPASVTEMLEGLAAAGFVERHRSERDRRVVLTSLTDSGRGLVERRRARFEPLLRAALEPFAEDELVVAAAVLDRLRGMFEQVDDERRIGTEG